MKQINRVEIKKKEETVTTSDAVTGRSGWSLYVARNLSHVWIPDYLSHLAPAIYYGPRAHYLLTPTVYRHLCDSIESAQKRDSSPDAIKRLWDASDIVAGRLARYIDDRFTEAEIRAATACRQARKLPDGPATYETDCEQELPTT